MQPGLTVAVGSQSERLSLDGALEALPAAQAVTASTIALTRSFDWHAEVLRSCEEQSWRVIRASVVTKTVCLSCARKGLPSLCAGTLAAQGPTAAEQRPVAESRCLCLPCAEQPSCVFCCAPCRLPALPVLRSLKEHPNHRSSSSNPCPWAPSGVGSCSATFVKDMLWLCTKDSADKACICSNAPQRLLRSLFLQATRLCATSGMATRSRLSTLRTC